MKSAEEYARAAEEQVRSAQSLLGFPAGDALIATAQVNAILALAASLPTPVVS